MGEVTLEVRTGDAFNPSGVFERFATEATHMAANQWFVRLPSELHGLALANATDPDEIVHIGGQHPVDAYGWQDWSTSGPDENEMTKALLPPPPADASAGTAYRYDDAWMWDPEAPTSDEALLASLGLTEVNAQALEAHLGKGSWAWKAIKFGWKSGIGRDLRVQAAIYLTKQGWKILQEQSYRQRIEFERREFEQRTILNLAEIRRARLETGSEASRRKARKYYATLDEIIRTNS